MPSGSKKRKAAKKKKATEQAHVKSSHGDDDAKSQVEKDSDGGGAKSHDDKESDGGELSSSASSSQEHHSGQQHPSVEGGEEEEKGHSSSVRPVVPENKSSQDTGNKMDDGAMEVVPSESVKELHDGRSSGDTWNTSSSNSDDESKKLKARNSIPGTSSLSDSVQPDAPVPEEVSHREDSHGPVVVSFKSDNGVSSGSKSSVVVSLKPENGISVASDSKTAPVENLVGSGEVNLGFKETEKALPSPGEVPRVPLAKRNEETLPLSSENAGMSSCEMGYASKENDVKSLPTSDVLSDKQLRPSDVPNVEISNVLEHVKCSEETPEPSEIQPLVASPVPTTKNSSWKSCCGLFDVLTGSGR